MGGQYLLPYNVFPKKEVTASKKRIRRQRKRTMRFCRSQALPRAPQKRIGEVIRQSVVKNNEKTCVRFFFLLCFLSFLLDASLEDATIERAT
jgi:hypothetical protein